MELTLEKLGIADLSVEERLELIGLLWDTIVDAGAGPELTDEQREDLDRRVAALDANPDDVVTWEEVQAHLRRPR